MDATSAARQLSATSHCYVAVKLHFHTCIAALLLHTLGDDVLQGKQTACRHVASGVMVPSLLQFTSGAIN